MDWVDDGEYCISGERLRVLKSLSSLIIILLDLLKAIRADDMMVVMVDDGCGVEGDCSLNE